MTIKKRGTTARMLSASAILVLGLGAALFGLAGASNAIGEVGELPPPVVSDAADCVPSSGSTASYSGWSDDGAPVRTEENSAPAVGDASLERYLSAGSVDDPAEGSAAVDRWWHWNPGDADGAQVPTGPPPAAGWNTDNGNHGGFPDTVNEAINVSNEHTGNSSWFYHEQRAAVPGSDYLWQKQVRTLTPAVAPTQCVAGTDSDDRTLSEGDCETGEVTETFQFRLEQTAGAQDWGPWQTSDVTTRDMTPAELAQCDNGGDPGDPGDPGNPGGGEVAGKAEVLGIEAAAPAAGVAPAAAPTAVDAGLVAEGGQDSTTLWLLVGAAMVVAGASIGLLPARVRGKRSW